MAQVMAQVIPTEISNIIESNVRVTFPLNNDSVNAAGSRKPSLLKHEAFPGELASLRAQVAQNTEYDFSAHSVVTPPLNIMNKQLHSEANLLADQLIEVMPTGLVILDGNGIVVKINQVARDLLDEPILGQPWFSVIARSFNPREDDWHEISLKDGRRVKLEITSLGAQPGQLIMITDLTETRLLQDKISQMQRLSSLGKMVSTLAHQIRTPLSAAILYGENLASTQLPEVARLKFQEKLNARLHDLEQQVNDMLLFSKSGKEQVVKPLLINELINDTVSSMDALLTKASASVKVNLSDHELYVLGNKSALTGAIQNLLHNSLHAMSALHASRPEHSVNPLITIQVYRQANNIFLSVKDNGPGIAPKIRDKIFQPFYTSSSIGTGLGLSVVKSVVNAHQGDVNLLNEAGLGAHFVIKLPLLEQGKVSKANQGGEC